MRRALLFLAHLVAIAAAPSQAQDLVAITAEGTWHLDPTTGQCAILTQQDELEGATDGDLPGTAFTRMDTLDFLVRVEGAAGTPVVLGMLDAPVRELAFDELQGRLFGTDGQDLWLLPVPGGLAVHLGALHASQGPQPGELLALEFDPSRRVLLGADQQDLWLIDPDSARCDRVGPHGRASMGDLYYEPATGRVLAVVDSPSELVELDLRTGAATHLHWLAIGPVTGLASPTAREAGTAFCSAVPNSTGAAARTMAFGVGVAAMARHSLVTEGLPPGRPVVMLASQAPGWIGPGNGSMGPMCLLGSVAVFRNGVQCAGESGRVVHDLDLGQIPTSPLPTSVMPGDLWHFQAWYRDSVGGTPTSNTSLPLALEFL